MTAALLLTCVMLGDAAPQVRDGRMPPPAKPATISGVVVTDGDKPQPVRRAVVTLKGDGLRPNRGAITDDQGRFTIGNLPAGRFTLMAARGGFVTSSYGAKRPGRPGTAVAVAEGQRLDSLVLTLWRGAVIAGTLRDDSGAPVDGIAVSVTAARATGSPGILTLSNTSVTTNDLGEYRVFGLEPGAYYVSATPAAAGSLPRIALAERDVDLAFEALRKRQAAGAASTPPPPPAPLPPAFDYSAIYYPGTPSATQAAAITVAAGEERTGVDFSLMRVPTYVVEGVVTTADGRPAAGATVQVVAPRPPGAFATLGPLVFNATAGADGAFRFTQVTPGDYQLVARAAAQAPPPPTPGIVTPGPQGVQLWGASDIAVTTDVRGVGLVVTPGLTLNGVMRFDGASPPLKDFARLRVTALPPYLMTLRPGTSINAIAFAPAVPVKPDGTFQIASMPPGTFRFNLVSPELEASPWRLQSATVGDRDLLDSDFQVAA
ncbi:MAG TPA: carboxypeptidase-like regulatory domain-containing protein, partial [Vicinamibacterales bacterium]|nr:carboxypeptidase-like regulatory domain-containing protein [Vicinamibacterales bacterium]